jgi:hypothetical protein
VLGVTTVMAAAAGVEDSAAEVAATGKSHFLVALLCTNVSLAAVGRDTMRANVRLAAKQHSKGPLRLSSSLPMSYKPSSFRKPPPFTSYPPGPCTTYSSPPTSSIKYLLPGRQMIRCKAPTTLKYGPPRCSCKRLRRS